MGEEVIDAILARVLEDETSAELYELSMDLHISKNALSLFCDRFDLGGWFYDELTLADIDIVDRIGDMAEQRRREETDTLEEQRENERDRRRA